MYIYNRSASKASKSAQFHSSKLAQRELRELDGFDKVVLRTGLDKIVNSVPVAADGRPVAAWKKALTVGAVCATVAAPILGALMYRDKLVDEKTHYESVVSDAVFSHDLPQNATNDVFFAGLEGQMNARFNTSVDGLNLTTMERGRVLASAYENASGVLEGVKKITGSVERAFWRVFDGKVSEGVEKAFDRPTGAGEVGVARSGLSRGDEYKAYVLEEASEKQDRYVISAEISPDFAVWYDREDEDVFSFNLSSDFLRSLLSSTKNPCFSLYKDKFICNWVGLNKNLLYYDLSEDDFEEFGKTDTTRLGVSLSSTYAANSLNNWDINIYDLQTKEIVHTIKGGAIRFRFSGDDNLIYEYDSNTNDDIYAYSILRHDVSDNETDVLVNECRWLLDTSNSHTYYELLESEDHTTHHIINGETKSEITVETGSDEKIVLCNEGDSYIRSKQDGGDTVFYKGDCDTGEENEIARALGKLEVEDAQGDRILAINQDNGTLVLLDKAVHDLPVYGVGEPSDNQRPAFTNLPDTLEARVGEAYRFDVDASDADGDDLEFSDDTALFDVDAATGEIEFTPVAGDVGEHDVKLTVSDGRGGVAEKYVTLRVLGAGAEPQDYTILHVTDTHFNPYNADYLKERFEDLKSLGADAVIITGDFVDYASDENFARALGAVVKGKFSLSLDREGKIPLYVIPGNHDFYPLEETEIMSEIMERLDIVKVYLVSEAVYRSDGGVCWNRNMGAYAGETDFNGVDQTKLLCGGQVLWVGVNTGADALPPGGLKNVGLDLKYAPWGGGSSDSQVAALEDVLEAHKDVPVKIIGMHHPTTFKTEDGKIWAAPVENREELNKLAQKYNAIVLSGHTHSHYFDEPWEAGGAKFVVTPDFVDLAGYRLIKIGKAGEVTVKDAEMLEERMVATAHCPVKMTLTVDGKRIGQNNDGVRFDEVDGAHYSIRKFGDMNFATSASFPREAGQAVKVEYLGLADGDLTGEIASNKFYVKGDLASKFFELDVPIREGQRMLVDLEAEMIKIDADRDGNYEIVESIADGDFTAAELNAAMKESGDSGFFDDDTVRIGAKALLGTIVVGGVAYAIFRKKQAPVSSQKRGRSQSAGSGEPKPMRGAATRSWQEEMGDKQINRIYKKLGSRTYQSRLRQELGLKDDDVDVLQEAFWMYGEAHGFKKKMCRSPKSVYDWLDFYDAAVEREADWDDYEGDENSGKYEDDNYKASEAYEGETDWSSDGEDDDFENGWVE